MTDQLSPAAQAVMSAATQRFYCLDPQDVSAEDEHACIIAAALRAAADQVKHEFPLSAEYTEWDSGHDAGIYKAVNKFLSIAAELSQTSSEYEMTKNSSNSLPKDYIDSEHCGEDRNLLETFYTACKSEGGTSDEITLRGLRAVLARWGRPAPPDEGEVADEARYLVNELRDQADDLNPSLELFGLIHRGADLVEELLEDNKRLQSLNDTLAKCLDEKLCRHPIPVPPSEGEVAELVSAVHAAYADYGWVEEKQFIRFFDEVSRLASVIEEGCDCSVDGPINWQAEIELMCQRLKPVPVSERLPEPKNCIPHPRTQRGNWCWGFERCEVPLARPARWRLMHMETIEMEASHWISGQDLPIPSVEVEE